MSQKILVLFHPKTVPLNAEIEIVKMKGSTLTLWILVIVCTEPLIHSYKPVVIIHGLLNKRHSLDHLRDRIVQLHPGTNVTILNALNGERSLTRMWTQVRKFTNLTRPILQQSPDGVHLIGYSQGGLIARALVETMDDHNFDHFISLSAPQGGEFGDSFLRLLFPPLKDYVKEKVWKVFYRESGQYLSVGGYWRDPHHLPEYYNQSIFLPFLDNEVNHPNMKRYKSNFLRLGKLVLIGGPDDEVIRPWESSYPWVGHLQYLTTKKGESSFSHFACFTETESVLKLKQRRIFRSNLFGLKTLYRGNRLDLHTISNVTHHQWHSNDDVIGNYIIPYLT